MYQAVYYNPNHLKLLVEPLYVVYCEVVDHLVLRQLCHRIATLSSVKTHHWNEFLEGIHRWRELCFWYDQYDPVQVTVRRLDLDLLNRWESELAIQHQVKQFSQTFDLEISPETSPEGRSSSRLNLNNPAYLIGQAVEITLRDHQLKVYDVDFPQLQLSLNGGTACHTHLEYVRQLRVLPPFYIRPHVLRYLEPFLDTYQYPYPEWFCNLYDLEYSAS